MGDTTAVRATTEEKVDDRIRALSEMAQKKRPLYEDESAELSTLLMVKDWLEEDERERNSRIEQYEAEIAKEEEAAVEASKPEYHNLFFKSDGSRRRPRR